MAKYNNKLKKQYRIRTYQNCIIDSNIQNIYVIFDSVERLESKFIKSFDKNAIIINVEQFVNDWTKIEESNRRDKRLNINLNNKYINALQYELIDAIEVIKLTIDKPTQLYINLDFVGFACTNIIDSIIKTCKLLKPYRLAFNLQHHYNGIRLREKSQDKRLVESLTKFRKYFYKLKYRYGDFEEYFFVNTLNSLNYHCVDLFDSTTKTRPMKAYIFEKAG
jgi:hypothetical protein